MTVGVGLASLKKHRASLDATKIGETFFRMGSRSGKTKWPSVKGET